MNRKIAAPLACIVCVGASLHSNFAIAQQSINQRISNAHNSVADNGTKNDALKNAQVLASQKVENISSRTIKPKKELFSGLQSFRRTKQHLILDSLTNQYVPDSHGSQNSMGAFVASSLQNSDALKSALHEAGAANEAVNTAAYSIFPTISIQSVRSRRVEASSYIGSMVDTTTITNSINASLRLDFANTSFASVRSAKYSALSADMQYLSNERQAVAKAAEVYLQVLGGQKLIASLSSTVKRMKRLLYATRAKYKAGFASKTDIAQVKSEFAGAKLQLSQAENSLKSSEIKWKGLTGYQVKKHLSIPNIAQLVPKSKKSTLQKALASNPVIKGGEYRAKAAQAQTLTTAAQFLPNITINGNLGLESGNNFSLSDEPEWAVGVQLNVPLINLAATSQYKQAQETAYARKYQALDQKRKLRQDIESNWESLGSINQQYKILQEKVKAQKNILKGISQEVKAGLRPIGDQLREEIKYSNSQTELIQNQLNKVAIAFQIAIHFDDFSLASLK